MPWLINENAIEIMLRAARSGGGAADDWWRDEVALDAEWQIAGYPMEPNAGAGKFECGDYAAMIMRHQPEGQTEIYWTLCSLVPAALAQDWTPKAAMFGPLKVKLPDATITQWTARKILDEPTRPAASGDRVACCGPLNAGLLGIAVRVAENGRVETVQREIGGAAKLASSYAKHWFKLDGRDKAFDWFWQRGQGDFTHYRNMLGQMAAKQKKLDKLEGGSVAKAPPASRPLPAFPDARPEDKEFADAFRAGRRTAVGAECPYQTAHEIEGWTEGTMQRIRA